MIVLKKRISMPSVLMCTGSRRSAARSGAGRWLRIESPA
jgi:hypothetical protein